MCLSNERGCYWGRGQKSPGHAARGCPQTISASPGGTALRYQTSRFNSALRHAGSQPRPRGPEWAPGLKCLWLPLRRKEAASQPPRAPSSGRGTSLEVAPTRRAPSPWGVLSPSVGRKEVAGLVAGRGSAWPLPSLGAPSLGRQPGERGRWNPSCPGPWVNTLAASARPELTFPPREVQAHPTLGG